jgi:hypothetical protein
MDLELSITTVIIVCIVWFIFHRSIKTVATNADTVLETTLQHVNDIVGVNALEAQVEIQRRTKDALANLGSTETLADPLAEYRKLRGLKH